MYLLVLLAGKKCKSSEFPEYEDKQVMVFPSLMWPITWTSKFKNEIFQEEK